MKVSPTLVGRVVSIQLARAIYIIDYKGHVKFADGRERLIGAPAMSKNDKGSGPAVMDVLPGCDVIEVTEESITVSMDINGNVIHNTFPTALIVNIAEVMEFESEKIPTVTERIRAPKSQIIAP